MNRVIRGQRNALWDLFRGPDTIENLFFYPFFYKKLSIVVSPPVSYDFLNFVNFRQFSR